MPGALIEGGVWSILLALGAATTRPAVALAMLPIFSPDLIPATVRNSIMLTFGLVSYWLQPPLAIGGLAAVEWLGLYAKEALVGLIIGFFFGSALYAIEMAGQLIDMKIGSNMAQVLDPLSGHQTSLFGALLGRSGHLVFIGLGGLTIFVLGVMESYALWPMAVGLPHLPPRGVTVFELEFGRMMALAIALASPFLGIMLLIDMALGLLNRFAPQFNAFQFSMSIKAMGSAIVMIILLSLMLQAVAADVLARPGTLRTLLSGLH